MFDIHEYTTCIILIVQVSTVYMCLTNGADKVLSSHHLAGIEQQSLTLLQLMPVINNTVSLSAAHYFLISINWKKWI